MDYVNLNVLVVISCKIILQDVTIGGSEVKGAWDSSVLFFTTAYKSTTISKSLIKNLKRN